MRQQGCSAADWSQVLVRDGFRADRVREVRFSGTVKMGRFDGGFELPGGITVDSGVYHAMLHNVEIGDDVRLYNINNYIANYRIGRGTCIENINSILVDGETCFGNGVRVAVMNEGGGREIPIFDHLSASFADAYHNTVWKNCDEKTEKKGLLVGSLAAPAAHAVDVALEVAAPYDFCEQMLCENRDCAGVDGDRVLKGGAQLRGQYHVTHTDSGGDRARESVHVNDAPLRLQREERVLRLGRHGELGIKIIFYDKPVLLGSPSNVPRAA